MLCVLIPPPSMPSTALEPVLIVKTVARRSDTSTPVAKLGGWCQLSHAQKLTSSLAQTSCSSA